MIRLIVSDLGQVDSNTLANLDTIETCALLELALAQGLRHAFMKASESSHIF